MTARPATGHVRRVERKRGGQVYYAKLRVGQDQPRQHVSKRIGPAWTGRGRPPAGYFTKRTAEAKLREMLADADRGTLAITARSTGITFADAAAEWLRYVADVREREASTLRDYRGVVNHYLVPRFGERDISTITPPDIEAYRDWAMRLTRADGTRQLGNRTIVRHLMVLHGVFKRAMRVWGLPSNPAAADLVDRPRVRYSGEFRTLSPDEVRLVAGAMTIPAESALVIVAAFTGLRLGELRALRWSDVDFALQRVHVRRSLGEDGEKVPKSGKVRSAPMVDEVITTLDRLSQRAMFTGPEDLVFCDAAGEYLSDGMLRRRFYGTLESLGLPRVRIHDLRHSFGTIAVQAFAISDVQGMLGHAHISTTMRYVHHTPGANDAARLQAVLGGNGAPNRASEPTFP